MDSFTGIYEHYVDNKYRLSIPSSVRTQTSDVGLFLYDRGEPSILYLLPGDFEGGLEQYTQRLQEQAPNPLKSDFNLETMLRAIDTQINIQRIKWDNLGRTVIGALREKGVRSKQKICFVGVGKYLVLYLGDRSQLRQYLQEKAHQSLDLAQR